MSLGITYFDTAFGDFESLRSQLSGVDLELVPLRTGPFSGRTTAIIGGDVAFTHGKFVSDHRYRGTSHKSQVLLGIHFGGQGTAHFGSNVAMQGDLSVLQPRQEHWGRMGGMFEYAALSIDIEELARLSGSLIGSDVLWTNGQIRAPREVRAAAATALEELTKVAFQPAVAQDVSRLEMLKRSLLYPYLLVAAHGSSERNGLAFEANASIVRRAEAWMDKEPPTRLHVIDLCLALGHSLRTVQRAFHETLGVGPAHYLAFYQLSKVRQILMTCDPMIERVSHVALDHGFWELGRFAGLYRKTYGEKPSETLRRRR